MLKRQTRNLLAILTVILILGAGLRIIGMTWGLPYQLEPDEPVLFINAWERWSTGEPTLKNEYPPLYLEVLVWQREFITDVFGADSPQVVYFFFGRWNSILISLLIIAVAYRLGHAAAGWASGIVFALFMALEPLSVQQLGWIIKVDNLAWLFTVMTLFATIIAGRQRSWRWMGLALVLGALATVTKYNLVFVFFAPLYVFINWRLRREGLALAILLVSIIGGIFLAWVIIKATWVDQIVPAFNHCAGESADIAIAASGKQPIDWLPCGPFLTFQSQAYPFYTPDHFWGSLNTNVLRHIDFQITHTYSRWRLVLLVILMVFLVWKSSKSEREVMAMLVGMIVCTVFLFAKFGVEQPLRQFYILIPAGGLLLAMGIGAVREWDNTVYVALLAVVFIPLMPGNIDAHRDLRKLDSRAVTAEYFLDHARRGEAITIEYDRVEFTHQYGGFPQSDGYFNTILAASGLYMLDVEDFFKDGIYYVVTDDRAQGEDASSRHTLPSDFDLLLDMTGDTYTGPARRIYRTFTPDYALEVAFGSMAILYGYDLDRDGDSLNLTLYWQAQEANPPDYTLFVHLIDPVSGEPVLLRDRPPERHTSQWEKYEWVFDARELDLTDVPPGSYTLEIGFYNPVDGARLPVDGDKSGVLQLTAISISG